MFSSLFTFVPLALLAASAVAETRPRSVHNSIAKRRNGDLAKRYSSARWSFYDAGLGACGQNNSGSDFIVALNAEQFGSGYPGPNCFKQITMTYNGKTATATITDRCPGCPYGGLDLTRGLFTHFASEDEGIIYGEWSFVGDASSVPVTTSVSVAPTTSTKAWVAPTTSTKAWVAPTTTQAWVAPTTSTKAWVAPTTSTEAWVAPTTSTKAWVAPTTSTKAWVAPTTSTKAWVAPTTSSSKWVAPITSSIKAWVAPSPSSVPTTTTSKPKASSTSVSTTKASSSTASTSASAHALAASFSSASASASSLVSSAAALPTAASGDTKNTTAEIADNIHEINDLLAKLGQLIMTAGLANN